MSKYLQKLTKLMRLYKYRICAASMRGNHTCWCSRADSHGMGSHRRAATTLMCISLASPPSLPRLPAGQTLGKRKRVSDARFSEVAPDASEPESHACSFCACCSPSRVSKQRFGLTSQKKKKERDILSQEAQTNLKMNPYDQPL